MAELALSRKEAAALIGISVRTLDELIYRGEIPAKKINAGTGKGRNGTVIIPRKALEDWLNETDKPKARPNARTVLAGKRRKMRRGVVAAPRREHGINLSEP